MQHISAHFERVLLLSERLHTAKLHSFACPLLLLGCQPWTACGGQQLTCGFYVTHSNLLVLSQNP